MNKFQKLLNKEIKNIFSHSGGGYWNKNDSYYYARKVAKEYIKIGTKLGGKIDEYIKKGCDLNS